MVYSSVLSQSNLSSSVLLVWCLSDDYSYRLCIYWALISNREWQGFCKWIIGIKGCWSSAFGIYKLWINLGDIKYSSSTGITSNILPLFPASSREFFSMTWHKNIANPHKIPYKYWRWLIKVQSAKRYIPKSQTNIIKYNLTHPLQLTR